MKPAKRAFSCATKVVFVTLRLVVGRRPKGRRGAWRRSFPRSDRGYRMRHLSDLLANALPRPFRRRNAARQAGSVSWSRASANTVSQPPTRSARPRPPPKTKPAAFLPRALFTQYALIAERFQSAHQENRQLLQNQPHRPRSTSRFAELAFPSPSRP